MLCYYYYYYYYYYYHCYCYHYYYNLICFLSQLLKLKTISEGHCQHPGT